MKRRKKTELPPPPTGYELLDLQWADMASDADVILSSLPREVDESWGTEAGGRRFLHAMLKAMVAREEVERTQAPLLRRLRQRKLRVATMHLKDYARCIAAAHAGLARRAHPRALPSQVLLLVRDQFRVVIERVCDDLDIRSISSLQG